MSNRSTSMDRADTSLTGTTLASEATNAASGRLLSPLRSCPPSAGSSPALSDSYGSVIGNLEPTSAGLGATGLASKDVYTATGYLICSY
jgi:hypothetical protein